MKRGFQFDSIKLFQFILEVYSEPPWESEHHEDVKSRVRQFCFQCIQGWKTSGNGTLGVQEYACAINHPGVDR